MVSVLNRSPPSLLAEVRPSSNLLPPAHLEVLLVDDYSDLADYPHLGEELEEWVADRQGVRMVCSLYSCSSSY